MHGENIIETFMWHVRSYFTLRLTRRVFFFALVAVILAAMLTSIFQANFVLVIFLVTCAFACFVTLVDSIWSRMEFIDKIHCIQENKANRKSQGEDNEFDGKANKVFDEYEGRYLKKKKREHDYVIALKLIFFVFFVFMIFNGV